MGDGEDREADPEVMREAVTANNGACRLGPQRKPIARWELEHLEREFDSTGITESALELYEQVIESRIVQFRMVATVAGTVYYLVCRRNQRPITLREIGDAGHSTKRKLGRLVTDLQRELDLVVLPLRPEVFLPEIRAQLDLPERVETLACELLETVREDAPALESGRSPAGVAAGILYR